MSDAPNIERLAEIAARVLSARDRLVAADRAVGDANEEQRAAHTELSKAGQEFAKASRMEFGLDEGEGLRG